MYAIFQRVDQKKEDPTSMKDTYHVEIIWKNVFVMVALHIGALYGFYLSFFCENPLVSWIRG